MNKVLLIALMLAVSACATKVKPEDAPLVVVSTPEHVVTSCVHKYDNGLNFKYRGDAVVYEQEMFGEEVYIFEYTTLTGEKVHISGFDMVNYDCRKAN